MAKLAKLTLSVYHRIEMGEREVDEKTFDNIARALGMNSEELQLKIYELDSSGALDELKLNSGKTGIGLFKGGYNDLPMSRLMMRTGESHEVTLSITGSIDEKGTLSMNPDTSVGAVLCPSTLSGEVGLYAVRLSADVYFLPAGAVLVVAPSMSLRSGDWAIYKDKVVRVFKENEQQQWCVRFFDGSPEKQAVSFDQLQKIAWIVLL